MENSMGDHEVIHDNLFETTEYFTSDILTQCKHNSNIPQFLLKYTNNLIIFFLKCGLYSQVLMIRRYILKTKVMNQDLVKDEDWNNNIKINTQNEDIKDMNRALFKYKDKTSPN